MFDRNSFIPDPGGRIPDRRFTLITADKNRAIRNREPEPSFTGGPRSDPLADPEISAPLGVIGGFQSRSLRLHVVSDERLEPWKRPKARRGRKSTQFGFIPALLGTARRGARRSTGPRRRTPSARLGRRSHRQSPRHGRGAKNRSIAGARCCRACRRWLQCVLAAARVRETHSWRRENELRRSNDTTTMPKVGPVAPSWERRCEMNDWEPHSPPQGPSGQ